MKSPAFSFYVRDWMCSRRVAAMSGDQVKAYMYLLCASWLEKPRATLPMSDGELAALARVSPEKWAKIGPGVMECFLVGRCKEHKERYYNELLLHVSRRSEQQASNRSNQTKTKHKPNNNQPLAFGLEDEDEDEEEAGSNTKSGDISSLGIGAGKGITGLTRIGYAAAEAVAARAKQ